MHQGRQLGLFVAIIIVNLVVYCWHQLPGRDAQILAAVRQNSTNSIQALVIKGADVNARRKENGATPHMIEARQGNQEAVELLLRLGADKGLKDCSGRTAQEYALDAGQTNMARLLR